MINEEKVILMTRASLYEEKKGKEKLKISRYFRHDYISLQILCGWFFMTVSFALCVVLWGACHMEYLLDNLHKMNLENFGRNIILYYVSAAAVYLCVLYGVCSWRYHAAKKSVGSYTQTLRKLSEIYAQERRHVAPDAVTEEKRHDELT